MTSQSEAKFWADKGTLERSKLKLQPTIEDKSLAVGGLKIAPESFDKIVGKPQEKPKAKKLKESKDEPEPSKPKQQSESQLLKILDGLIEAKPIYYDEHGIFWSWSQKDFKWTMTDEVGILLLISDYLKKSSIEAKYRSSFLNWARQHGRRNKPKEVPKDWLQFKGEIVSLETGKRCPASSDYFLTSPLPYPIGQTDSTPTIDRLFSEWVVAEGIQDKTYVKTLYEIIAYSCSREQFLQSIIAFTGSGSNGKSTFINLLVRFLGQDNVCASSLQALSTRSFETSALYKKLACCFGEVDAHDLSNTNIIKQLTGEDRLRYEFKGKTPFSEYSPTTPIIATNSLPITPDKSKGFYRRWLIVDFPNQFAVKLDILSQIPEQEYSNLAFKIIEILSELRKRGEFTNAGTIEDRTKKYEQRSNPLAAFISENYADGGMCRLKDFANHYNHHLLACRLRPLTIQRIGKLLRDEGYEVGSRKFRENNDESAKAVIGLQLSQPIAKFGSSGGKDSKEPPKPPKSYTPNKKLTSEKQKELPELPEPPKSYTRGNDLPPYHFNPKDIEEVL